jgi:acetoin utilization protein AcuB
MSRLPQSISQLMSPRPICVEQDQMMSEAHRLMRNHRVRHLPVLHRGALVGIVSAGDLHLLETLRGVDPEQIRVEEAMTAAPYCVRPDTALEEVIDVMAANKYGCALVVSSDEVVGIFTTIDALVAFAQLLRART